MADLSERQYRLALWRDYLKLLRRGILDSDNGSVGSAWTIEQANLVLWLDVAETELESEIMHLEQGTPEYCRWDESPKDLSTRSPNE